MKFGCCVGKPQLVSDNAAFAVPELTARLEWFKSIGCDFLEIPIDWLAALDEGTFTRLSAAIKKADIPIGAGNLFIPRTLPLVGPPRDLATLKTYMKGALARLHSLNCPYAVFGSGGARQFPADYPAENAWQELQEFCLAAAEEASRNNVTIALEPLCYKECNVLNTVSAGYSFVDVIGHPNFQLLADSYHMEETSEPISVFKVTYPHLRHIHTADTGRFAPGSGQYPHAELLRTLQEVGYNQGVSVECRWRNFDEEAPTAMQHLKKMYAAI